MSFSLILRKNEIYYEPSRQPPYRVDINLKRPQLYFTSKFIFLPWSDPLLLQQKNTDTAQRADSEQRRTFIQSKIIKCLQRSGVWTPQIFTSAAQCLFLKENKKKCCTRSRKIIDQHFSVYIRQNRPQELSGQVYPNI